VKQSKQVEVTFFVLCLFFQGTQDGFAVLFPQKKVTKENSRLCLFPLKSVIRQVLCYPKKSMPHFFGELRLVGAVFPISRTALG